MSFCKRESLYNEFSFGDRPQSGNSILRSLSLDLIEAPKRKFREFLKKAIYDLDTMEFIFLGLI
ncbi:hypothetical protein LEP1GSC068_2077 [Leptospira sp. Fiocruz LV3954]|nr:hypothetical protein LEP1GSC068_2077 [Leptospira sp. Fiocruz LV3954]EMI63621.1 hypothetical protein LEP1GSC076_3657 [Leptospira sp. Fiocruz LV4135]